MCVLLRIWRNSLWRLRGNTFFLRVGFCYLKLIGKSLVNPEIQLSPPPSTRITSMRPAWALGIKLRSCDWKASTLLTWAVFSGPYTTYFRCFPMGREACVGGGRLLHSVVAYYLHVERWLWKYIGNQMCTNWLLVGNHARDHIETAVFVRPYFIW